MAHDPTYTTVDEVSGALLLATKGLTPTYISGAIIRAEGIIDSVMRTRHGTDLTFDFVKHGILKDTAVALAGYFIIVGDVEEYASNSSASLTADMLWAVADRNLAILSDQRVIKYLKEI